MDEKIKKKKVVKVKHLLFAVVTILMDQSFNSTKYNELKAYHAPLGTWLLLRPACNAKDTTDQDLRITVTTSYFPLTAAETARYPIC